MPGDFHVHEAFVDQLLARAVGADGPDPIDLVPGAFMAIHDEAGIGGRELDMVEPVGRGDDDLPLAGANVDGEDFHRNLRFQPLVEAHLLGFGEGQRLAVGAGGGIIGLAELLLDLGLSALLRAVGLERPVAGRPLAEQQAFVRVDRADRALCHGGDAARLAAVDVGGEDGGGPARIVAAAAGIIGAARPASGEEKLQIAALDQRRHAPVGERHDADAIGRRDDHLVALRRVAVLVEIEAGGARGLIGDLDDPMPGGGVGPLPDRLGEGGAGPGERRERYQRNAAFHREVLLQPCAGSASGISARFSIAASPHWAAALVETFGHSTVGPR